MALSTTPFAFVKKFSGHGAFELVLTNVADKSVLRSTRSLSIKSSRLSPNTLAKPAGQLSLDGVDVNYNLVAGGWQGQKTYYVYVTKDQRSCFFPLSGVEYVAFKASSATLTKVAPEVVVPTKEATAVQDAETTNETDQEPTKEQKPTVTPRKAKRRAKATA